MESSYPKLYFYKRVVQAKLFIDENYAACIDLSNIADEAYFSKFHFNRIFKEVYRKTPHQHLTFVRLEKAAELLKAGNLVSETCYRVGFESLSSFTKLFKKAYGLNPSTYVSQQKSIKLRIVDSPMSFVPSCFAYKYGWLEK